MLALALQRLRVSARKPQPIAVAGRAAPVPGLPAAAGGAAQAAGEDGLSAADALTATEQAIQLDELIKWVRQQHDVRINNEPGERRLASDEPARVAAAPVAD